MSVEYDLVIIGSGPGGYVAAVRAGQYGLKTALVERDVLGGTCLNRGCIPTKALLHAGELLAGFSEAGSLGIVAAQPSVDLNRLYAYKDKTVAKLRAGIGALLKRNKVDLIEGTGILLEGPGVRVENDGESRTLSAKNVILATGSKPAVPPIPGLEETGYWTSRTMLETNPALPKSMIIIGGGVIGVESATILNDLGVKVTVVEMMDQLLPRMDPDVAETPRTSLKKSGIEIELDVKVTGVSSEGALKECRIQTERGEKRLQAAELMVAVGRRTVVDSAGIEEAGVELDRGRVRVDEHMRTNLPHVYAIGDVTGTWWLAHAASAEGLAAVDHIADRKNYTDRSVMPACVYTRPEIAAVGMTEEEARRAGREVRTGNFPLAANSKSMIMGETAGFVKVISEHGTGEILGAHIIGPRATDMIVEVAAAISAELTIEELGAVIHPHPTVSESIMEAVHDIEGLCIHKA